MHAVKMQKAAVILSNKTAVQTFGEKTESSSTKKMFSNSFTKIGS
jgi:hypothetical protein